MYEFLSLHLLHLLTIKFKGISKASPLQSFGSLPQPVIKTTYKPGVFSPINEFPSQHVAIKYISQPLNLEALLSELALRQTFLLSIAGLEVVLVLLILIHQVLGDSEELDHALTIRALAPLRKSNGQVPPVELDEPKFCAGHGVLPVVDVLLPDL